jgi:hypothetical protein
LPNPWPLGLISIIISLVTGLSRYKFEIPECTWKTKVGWGITILRSLGLGISAIINMHKGDYSSVSSDGFPALFSNVIGVIAAGRDHGEGGWGLGGLAAMFFGVFPRLVQLCLALWKPNTHDWLSPFRWSDGVQCVVNPEAKCQTHDLSYNLPYCAAPVYQIDGSEGIQTPVDYVRAFAWLFVFMLCLAGLIYLWRARDKATMIGRKSQVVIAYFALAFSIALVFSSAIIYGQERRVQALDCRALKRCFASQPLPCPTIALVTPRSSNGFFKQWAKEISPWDIPAILT